MIFSVFSNFSQTTFISGRFVITLGLDWCEMLIVASTSQGAHRQFLRSTAARCLLFHLCARDRRDRTGHSEIPQDTCSIRGLWPEKRPATVITWMFADTCMWGSRKEVDGWLLGKQPLVTKNSLPCVSDSDEGPRRSGGTSLDTGQEKLQISWSLHGQG